MRNIKVYKKAREYLGLSREQVCDVLKIDMEDLIVIEEDGLEPSFDLQGQLMRLYGLTDIDFKDMFKYTKNLSYEGLSERDIKSIKGIFRMVDELKVLDK